MRFYMIGLLSFVHDFLIACIQVDIKVLVTILANTLKFTHFSEKLILPNLKKLNAHLLIIDLAKAGTFSWTSDDEAIRMLDFFFLIYTVSVHFLKFLVWNFFLENFLVYWLGKGEKYYGEITQYLNIEIEKQKYKNIEAVVRRLSSKQVLLQCSRENNCVGVFF